MFNGEEYITYCAGGGPCNSSIVWGGGSVSPREGYDCYVNKITGKYQFSINNNSVMELSHSAGNNYMSHTGNGAWSVNSDRRIKSNIQKEERLLNRLMNLDVVNYHYKWSNRMDQREIGFIAQDILPYFPEMVIKSKASKRETENGLSDVLKLNYDTFGVLAIGGIKELKIETDKNIITVDSKITVLKEKTDMLKNDIQDLVRRVEKLELE